MKKQIKSLMLPVLFFCAAVSAQEVKINRVETSEPWTPLYQNEEGLDTIQVRGLMQAGVNNKKWFRIAAEFESRDEWTDRLTFEYYVLFPDHKNVFKGVVKYVDIPQGREHLSEMYMHFNSYERYFKRGTISYAVVVLIDGKEVAVETNKRSPENWWKDMTIHPCGLLDRSMTPFVVFNVESFQAQDSCSWE